jgi:hypothetical protein
VEVRVGGKKAQAGQASSWRTFCESASVLQTGMDASRRMKVPDIRCLKGGATMKNHLLLAAVAFGAVTCFAQTPAAKAVSSAATAVLPATASTDATTGKVDSEAERKRSETAYMAAKKGCEAKSRPDRKWCLRDAESSHDKAEAGAGAAPDRGGETATAWSKRRPRRPNR